MSDKPEETELHWGDTKKLSVGELVQIRPSYGIAPYCLASVVEMN